MDPSSSSSAGGGHQQPSEAVPDPSNANGCIKNLIFGVPPSNLALKKFSGSFTLCEQNELVTPGPEGQKPTCCIGGAVCVHVSCSHPTAKTYDDNDYNDVASEGLFIENFLTLDNFIQLRGKEFKAIFDKGDHKDAYMLLLEFLNIKPTVENAQTLARKWNNLVYKYKKNEKLNKDWVHRSAMKAVMAANHPAEQVEGQRGEGRFPRPELIHASTQTTADTSMNKKRKLADSECAHPQEQAENPLAALAALVAEMKQLVEAHVSAEEDFKMKVDTLAQKILDLKFV